MRQNTFGLSIWAKFDGLPPQPPIHSANLGNFFISEVIPTIRGAATNGP